VSAKSCLRSWKTLSSSAQKVTQRAVLLYVTKICTISWLPRSGTCYWAPVEWSRELYTHTCHTHVYTHTHTNTYAHTNTHKHRETYTHAQKHIPHTYRPFIHKNIYIHTHIHIPCTNKTYTHIHMHIYTLYMHIHTHTPNTCTLILVYAHTYTYTHTNIHIHTHQKNLGWACQKQCLACL
jgi:hypothetical protein